MNNTCYWKLMLDCFVLFSMYTDKCYESVKYQYFLFT